MALSRTAALMLLGLWLALSFSWQPAAAAELDVRRDPRLTKRLALRSEGFPLSRVLQRLGAQCGVTLGVTGSLGDERLIAFVPEAPLVEILDAIADLYRLTWTRGAGDRPAYRLIKTPAAAREEANLRKQCLEETLREIMQQIGANGPATGVRDTHDPPRAAILKVLFGRAQLHWERLLNSGTVKIPVRSLPRAEREGLVASLQPYLDAQHALALREQQAALELRRAEGEDVSNVPPLDGPANRSAVAEDCVLSLELRSHQGVEFWAGFRSRRSDFTSTYTLFRSRHNRQRDAGTALYQDRSPRPRPGADAPVPLEPADPFRRPLAELPGEPEPVVWWLQLQALADASGQAIYADDYPQHGQGRGMYNSGGIKGDTLTRALDRLCGPGRSHAHSSIWWRRGNAALVRSRVWLWEGDTLIPAEFSDRLAAVLERNGDEERAGAQALSLLASLSLRQAQGLFTEGGDLEAWKLAAVVPSRLSLSSRRRVCREGITWDQLPPADQQVLLGLTPPAEVNLLPGYTAAVQGRVSRSAHDSGESLQLGLTASWGADRVDAAVEIPLSPRNRHGLLVLDAAQRAQAPVTVSPLVGALYYPWFGTPAASGSYRHHQGVSLAGRRIGNFAHYPLAGPYDSTDETTLRRHLRQAREAGIGLLVCSWGGVDSFEHRSIEKLLRLTEGSGIQVCLLVEPYRALAKSRTATGLAEQLGKGLRSLALQPGYLRVGGRPVVFVSSNARELHETQAWADALALLAKSDAPGVFAVTESIHPSDALVFGGLRLGYLEYNSRHTPSTRQRLRAQRRLVIGTVHPGFDFRHQVRDPDAWLDRGSGGFYREQWAEALAERPDWILVNSFNNWEDGSEIEPSVEFGDLYLRLTAQGVGRFRPLDSSRSD